MGFVRYRGTGVVEKRHFASLPAAHIRASIQAQSIPHASAFTVQDHLRLPIISLYILPQILVFYSVGSVLGECSSWCGSRTRPSSEASSDVSVLPSRRYTHSPMPPPSFWCMPSPVTTQSYRLGPDNGDASQICLFGGCLLIT